MDTLVEEAEETEELDTDEREIIYEHVQQFIFEGAPFESFVSALKLFVSRDSATIPAISTRMRHCFNYLALRYCKISKPDHQTRLSWSCASIPSWKCKYCF